MGCAGTMGSSECVGREHRCVSRSVRKNAADLSSASGWCGHTMTQFDAYGDPLFVHYNLMKQIPSGIGRGFSWGRMKQMPLFNAFPPERKHAHANELPYSDHDLALPGLGNVDADMLADADDQGYARAPAREEIRRRAARERGVKAGFHGGWISALWYVSPSSLRASAYLSPQHRPQLSRPTSGKRSQSRTIAPRYAACRQGTSRKRMGRDETSRPRSRRAGAEQAEGTARGRTEREDVQRG